MIYQEFPKWKYHKDFRLGDLTAAGGVEVPGKAQIVLNHDAELALGQDWYDSPAEAERSAAAKPLEQESPSTADYRQPGFKRSNPIHMTTDPTRL
jgi:hypothetical protein